MVADAPLREEGLLGGRYAIEGLIGRGGMADVYRAHDLVLGRAVAVKLLRRATADEAERARFTDEARTLARLNHPGLVTILDAAVADDVPYQVMELVDGPSLAECCRTGALEPARVAAIGAQLTDALAHAHAAGIVHRDLKPGNVLLGADDRALLTDFGIARLLSATVRHTATGATVGTPAYLAPEQVRGQEVTPATDVYALGLLLLEALTGKRAYRGAPVEAALARLTAPPAIPDAVPAAWHGLLRAMTAFEPAERPSAAAVGATLRGLASGLDPAVATATLRGEPGTATPVDAHRDRGSADTAPIVSSPLRRGRRWAAAAAVTAVALALLVAMVAASARDGRSGDTATLGGDEVQRVPAAVMTPPAAPRDEHRAAVERETPDAAAVDDVRNDRTGERRDGSQVDSRGGAVTQDAAAEEPAPRRAKPKGAAGNGKPKTGERAQKAQGRGPPPR